MMHDIAVVAVSACSAFTVILLLTVLFVHPVVDKVSADADDDGEHEQNGEQNQRLIRNHSKHYEGLVSGRSDHHCDKCPETEHAVGVK